MKSGREEREQGIIAEQAARWLCDLREPNETVEQEFLAWLKRSPRHIKEFLFADTVWREVGQVRSLDVRIDAIIAEARTDQDRANIVPLQNTEAHRSVKRIPARRNWWRAIAAGFALVAVGSMIFYWGPARHPSYSTVVGEQRSLRLDDGSLMHLNTHSRVEVRYSKRAREIHLIDGEALFTVEQDAARPFTVFAGDTIIRALGTQFNVHRSAGQTTVAVISGAVQVTPDPSKTDTPALAGTRLDAGQEAHIGVGGKISRATAETASALAWRERRLVFRGETLAEVASEFNRYNERQIQVLDAAAQHKLLSGTFDADDPESLVLFLRKLNDLSVESSRDGLVIRSK